MLQVHDKCAESNKLFTHFLSFEFATQKSELICIITCNLPFMSSSFPSLAHTPRAFPLPSIAEDTLHYAIHLPETAESADKSTLAVLISDHVQSLLVQPWLWNKDGWELKAAEGSKRKLEGTMRVGDAVDDEWLVVWLLREVSKKWKDLVIR
jgi:hypothetical protein